MRTPVVVTVAKEWNGNTRVREDSRGRLHVSQGRWEWIVVVNGIAIDAFRTRRDAVAAAATIEQKGISE